MAESIKNRCNALSGVRNTKQLIALLEQMRADNAALRTAFLALTAKMDADFADVSNASIDYASSVNPAAPGTTA
jgi:hypothetical protein